MLQWTLGYLYLFQLWFPQGICPGTGIAGSYGSLGYPGGASCKEPACQCRRYKRCGFDSWVRKIPWRRPWQPTPVLLPRESPWTEEPGRRQSIGLQSWTWLKWLCMHTCMVVLFLVFKGISILFSTEAASIYIPTNSVEGFPSLHILSSIYCW